ncbi:hypothetical protein AA105894_1664 [Asaia spathodeae NBRC 105894]|nr:hypothetical protein AA105894_1664 [Asaia spathodeae NBRC 105894]
MTKYKGKTFCNCFRVSNQQGKIDQVKRYMDNALGDNWSYTLEGNDILVCHAEGDDFSTVAKMALS